MKRKKWMMKKRLMNNKYLFVYSSFCDIDHELDYDIESFDDQLFFTKKVMIL